MQARAHPNVLATTAWLNNLYHANSASTASDSDSYNVLKGVDLSTPVSYADRFRILKPGTHWDAHPPHVDGGAIERWEDPNFRTCYADILAGDWEKHDPYDLVGRLSAKTSLYGRPNQVRSFLTFNYQLELAYRFGPLSFFFSSSLLWREGKRVPDIPRLACAERDGAERRNFESLPKCPLVERVYNPTTVLPLQRRSGKQQRSVSRGKLGIRLVFVFPDG